MKVLALAPALLLVTSETAWLRALISDALDQSRTPSRAASPSPFAGCSGPSQIEEVRCISRQRLNLEDPFLPA